MAQNPSSEMNGSSVSYFNKRNWFIHLIKDSEFHFFLTVHTAMIKFGHNSTSTCQFWFCYKTHVIVSKLMIAKSEMAETCSWYVMYNCKYSCVMTAMPMHDCSFMF